jgi:hypothetical protein
LLNVEIQGKLLNVDHTQYESKHPMVEALPVLSNGRSKSLVQLEGRRVRGDWIKLKDEFCLFFFPIDKVIPLRI